MLCIVWLIRFHQFDRAKDDAAGGQAKEGLGGSMDGNCRQQFLGNAPHCLCSLARTSYELLQLHYMQMMKARKQILLPRAMATATTRQTHTHTDTHMKGIVWLLAAGHRTGHAREGWGEQDVARGSYADIYISKQLLLSCGSFSSQQSLASSLLGILGIVRPA